MNKVNYFLLAILSLFMFSCINNEGVGGNSTVEGYVYKVIHPNDVYSLEADTFPAAKENVYIVYGNEPIYGDKMETGYDGFYRFKYLTKGSYKVYAYSTFPDTHKEAVIDSVTVSANDTKNIPDIYIHEGKSLETSYIKGSVMAKYYNKGNVISGYLAAYGQRVYIRKAGSVYQFDEVRTGIDGVFMFQELEVGDYEVFVVSEEPGTEIQLTIVKSVSITGKGEIQTIDEPFYININV